MLVVQCGDFEFRKIEALAQHVYADHDPALSGPQLAKSLQLRLRGETAVNYDRIIFRKKLAVAAMQLDGGIDYSAARHSKMNMSLGLVLDQS